MSQSGLVTHPDTNQTLSALAAQPPHALLLSGPVGIGKTLQARELAAKLLHIDTPTSHAYYRELAPIKGTIPIEQVRVLTQFFRLQVPGKAAVKRVVVVQDAEAMGTEAQNAFLKLLEEPPAGSVLILTSSRPEGLLPTIRSRVQIRTLAAPTNEQLLKHFSDQGNDTTRVQQTLRRYAGNVAAATKDLSDEISDDASVVLVKQVLAADSYGRLLLVDQLAKQKELAASFVHTLANVASASLNVAAAKQAPSVARWQGILNAAYVAEDNLERSANTKLTLTDLMLSL